MKNSKKFGVIVGRALFASFLSETTIPMVQWLKTMVSFIFFHFSNHVQLKKKAGCYGEKQSQNRFEDCKTSEEFSFLLI